MRIFLNSQFYRLHFSVERFRTVKGLKIFILIRHVSICIWFCGPETAFCMHTLNAETQNVKHSDWQLIMYIYLCHFKIYANARIGICKKLWVILMFSAGEKLSNS
uniref:Uncharacterized protein n=1 Tax=Schistocephalus solidus TaxID=70667 RepID=A0A0X3PNU1_SCHSO